MLRRFVTTTNEFVMIKKGRHVESNDRDSILIWSERSSLNRPRFTEDWFWWNKLQYLYRIPDSQLSLIILIKRKRSITQLTRTQGFLSK